MENKKILGLMGLAARARKVTFGADATESEIKQKHVNLIIVATDSSERTKDKFKKLSEQYQIPIIIMGKIEELSKAIVGIKEVNLSKEILKINNGGDVIG